MSRLLKSLPQINLNNIRLISSTIAKGITKQNNPTNQNADLLVTNLKESYTLEEVFSLVNTHHSIMNNQHIMQALKTIFTLQKQERNLKSTSKKITDHPDFEQLCAKLKSVVGTIEVDEALDALKVLTYLEVPSNSRIYQTLLQLLRHSINQLSIAQIVFLSFLLSKADKTPLSKALHLALPIVFEAQVPVKLNMANIKLLAESLSYASKTNISRPCVELIMNGLLKQRLNEKVSMGVLWTLCDFPPADYYEPLLNKVLKNLVINSRKLKYQDMETAMTKLTFKYSSKYPFYFNEDFFDACSQRILEEDLGFEYAIHFLRKSLKLNYFNQAVLDYAVDVCRNNPDLLKVGDPSHVYNFVCSLTLADYNPIHLDAIKDALIEFDWSRLEGKENLLRYATSLCIIGVYSRPLLQKVFDLNYLDAVYQKRFMYDIENILLLSQLIKTYKPEFNDLLDEGCLKRFRACTNLIKENPLEGMLNKIFGGPNFVRTNVYSKMHHFIDHIIVLKENGLPVEVDIQGQELEDIMVDTSSQMILILVLKNHHYTLGIRRLRGTTAMSIKTLEDNGYNVVTIDLDSWKRCPNFEKIPYVMEQIKQKTDCIEKMSDYS